MKIFSKIKILNNGSTIKEYKFFNLTIIKKQKDQKIRYKLLGIPLISYKNKKFPFSMPKEGKKTFLSKIKNLTGKKLILWVDHSLGGGTETYSQRQFTTFPDICFVRLQYFPAYQQFLLSLPANNTKVECLFSSLNEVYEFLSQIEFSEIVTNNIVGYPNTLDMLKFIADLKNIHQTTKVSFKGHDFQCICPSFNLINCDDVFCHLQYEKGCNICMQRKILGNNSWENYVLRSGGENIEKWRKGWGSFFRDVVDEVTLFSKAISPYFIKIYPQIKEKIKIVPHQIPPLPKVSIEPHKGINIGVLGSITSLSKGKDIIFQMCHYLKKYQNVQIIIIGSYHSAPHNLKVTGKYIPSELPLIMAKEKIDVVFIPSIWPETFSYTTSEAISMGIPVVCYDFGAQAERISAYNKGLILKKIDVDDNLKQIIQFVKRNKKG